MAKTINLKLDSSKVLHKMDEKEIREMVINQADAMLKSLPKDLKVSEVNSVRLQSSLKEVADIGVWAQWTRACCDRRRLIEDFEDPRVIELGIENPALEKAVFQNHFDSNFSIKQVTEPESLAKIKAAHK
ncbi:MAG: hypothetical protein ABWZ25_06505 [Chitinophagaceae bacterium]